LTYSLILNWFLVKLLRFGKSAPQCVWEIFSEFQFFISETTKKHRAAWANFVFCVFIISLSLSFTVTLSRSKFFTITRTDRPSKTFKLVMSSSWAAWEKLRGKSQGLSLELNCARVDNANYEQRRVSKERERATTTTTTRRRRQRRTTTISKEILV